MASLCTKTVFVFIIIYAILHRAISTTRENENSLQTSILQNYNQYTRPKNLRVPDEPLPVLASFGLGLIRSFDEKLGILTTAIIVNLAWFDAQLSWNATAHGGIKETKLPRNKIWYPPFHLLNHADGFLQVGDERKDELVRIENTGLITWTHILFSGTICPADALYYPFNQQTCTIEFLSFYYTKEEMIITLNNNNVILDNYYQGNWIWYLISANIKNKDNPSGNLVKIVVELVMKRKPLYYILNVVLPILLIGILNVFVFLLPADSGERVGFSITMLLAMAVFLTIVSDNLPESISVVSMLLLCDLFLSVLIVICVILGLRLHFESTEKKISEKYMKLYKFFKCVCFKQKPRNKKIEIKEQTKGSGQKALISGNPSSNKNVNNDKQMRQIGIASSLQCMDFTQNMYYHPNMLVSEKENEQPKVTWKDISNMMDKICFWSFCSLQVIKFLVYVVIFGIQR